MTEIKHRIRRVKVEKSGRFIFTIRPKMRAALAREADLCDESEAYVVKEALRQYLKLGKDDL